ncbi:uncharacterized protein LOC128647617 [Bombina bombina]|uniref:uncharacterized protein LOC128647617 n=1 Tax=Bombina bombina TaxID=8345 RepID=UPI00235AC516|nr:uncharacterized protein LOC128647617 [Bombina bombina]
METAEWQDLFHSSCKGLISADLRENSLKVIFRWYLTPTRTSHYKETASPPGLGISPKADTTRESNTARGVIAARHLHIIYGIKDFTFITREQLPGQLLMFQKAVVALLKCLTSYLLRLNCLQLLEEVFAATPSLYELWTFVITHQEELHCRNVEWDGLSSPGSRGRGLASSLPSYITSCDSVQSSGGSDSLQRDNLYTGRDSLQSDNLYTGRDSLQRGATNHCSTGLRVCAGNCTICYM